MTASDNAKYGQFGCGFWKLPVIKPVGFKKPSPNGSNKLEARIAIQSEIYSHFHDKRPGSLLHGRKKEESAKSHQIPKGQPNVK
jgi:hypothetical protein